MLSHLGRSLVRPLSGCYASPSRLLRQKQGLYNNGTVAARRIATSELLRELGKIDIIFTVLTNALNVRVDVLGQLLLVKKKKGEIRHRISCGSVLLIP